MRKLSLLMLILVVLTSCSTKEELYSETKFIFGTKVVISIYPVAGRNIKKDLSALFYNLKEFKAIFNPRKYASLVQKLNMERQLIFKDDSRYKSLQQLLVMSLKIATLSKGAFDPTIYTLSKLWGFSGVQPLSTPPSASKIASAAKKVNYLNLKIDRNRIISLSGKAEIDLGGIAKGYAADLVATKLKRWGYNSGIIYVGGDIALLGYKKGELSKRKWEVGIQHPRLEKKYFCRLYIVDRAVVTSGDYEKFYIYKGQRFHHLLNPHTGYPTSEVISATVVGDSVAEADGYATAMMVLGAKKGIEFINRISNYEAIVIKKENSNTKVLFSNNFKKMTGYKKEQF